MPIFPTFLWLLSTCLEFLHFFTTSNKNCFKLHVQDQRDVHSSLLRLFSFTQMSKMFTFVTIVTRKKLIMQVVYLVYSHYPGFDNMTSRLSGYIWDLEDSYQYLCRIRCQAALSYKENIQLYLLGLLWLSFLLQANYLPTAGTWIYSNGMQTGACSRGNSETTLMKRVWTVTLGILQKFFFYRDTVNFSCSSPTE